MLKYAQKQMGVYASSKIYTKMQYINDINLLSVERKQAVADLAVLISNSC